MLRVPEVGHVLVCDEMLFIRVNESLVDDLSYERGIVPSRVALCDDLLRFSLSSDDLETCVSYFSTRSDERSVVEFASANLTLSVKSKVFF